MNLAIFSHIVTDKTSDYMYIGDVTTSDRHTTEGEICNCTFETSM